MDINPLGVQSLGTLRDSCKGALVTGHLSLWQLCWGNRGGGVPLLGALTVTRGGLWRWASLFMGSQLGNLEWAHLLGTLRTG
jgi:hypothetical protein